MRALRSFGLAAVGLVWAAAANGQVTVSPGALTNSSWTINVPYPLITITASGGVSPHSFAITSGALPQGLSLSDPVVVDLTTTQVTLSGTPTASNPFNFTVTATDGTTLLSGSQSYSGTINPAPSIAPSSLPTGEQGVLYSATLTGSGGTGTLTLVESGALPSNVQFNNGVFSGTPGPGSAGSYPITVTVTDSVGGTSGPQNYTILIDPPLSINPGSLPQGQVGVLYPTTTFTATGGSGSYSWSTTPSTVPAGLSFSNGQFSGTPTSTVSAASITLKVTDTLGGSATLPLSLTVISGPSISTTSLPASDVGLFYNQTLSATGGTSPYTWSLATGSPPTGITLSSAGVLSGTITGSTSTFTVKVTDSASGSNTQSLTITVNPAMNITTASVPQGDATKAYSQQLALTGGTSPFTWSLASGTLPSGITLSASGLLAGTTSSSGTFPFTAQVTDSASPTGSATKPLSLTINPPLTVTTLSLAPGDANAPYSQTLTASGGAQPYTWSISTGALPPGITLNPSTGVISGTTSVSGTTNITATVTDNLGNSSASPSYTLVINPTLTITTPPTLSSGSQNVPYSQSLGASGGASPYTWSITSGSLGVLTLNPTTGVISGTPTSSGTLTFTAQVTDSISISTSKSFTISITAGLTISTAPTLPGGAVGAPYSQSLVAIGGTPQYTWTITSGALPNGLLLNPTTGLISGTPTSSGNSSFTVQVNDSASGTASKSFTLAIASPLLITTAPGLPNGTVNTPYSQTLAATGGTPPYSWSITGGSLPAGLNFSGGVISGTPTSSGNFSFTAQVNDSASGSANKVFTLAIAGGLGISTAPTLPNATVGTVYGINLQASGGTAPYSWSITGGLLPGGLTLNPSSGAISGTPTNSGSFTFTVQVTDSTSVSASKAFSLTVAAALTITNAPTLPSGSAGVAYSQTLNATGGTAPFFLSISSGSLPAGLTLAGGAITGTPTSTGSFNFTVQVTDSASITASKQFSLSIFAGLTISSAPGLPNGTVGTAYSQTLLAVGGSSPYTWAIQAGGLPAGLTLNAGSGAITGSPTAGGTFNFTVQVTDSLSSTTTKVFTLAVAAGLAITNAPTLPSDSVGVAYSQALTASGGTTPYTWSISGGSLPGGLSLNSVSGAITGTPTAAGNFGFTVQVTDSASITATKIFALSIASGLTISNAPTLPNGTAGTAYPLTLAAVGGAPPYTWSITAGSLPSGMTLNPTTGAITGTPVGAGNFAFTARVTDNSSATASKGFTLTIASSLNITTAPALPSGSAGIAYSLNLGATGGAAPYSWSITAGSLPAGLKLDSASGAISGTPTSAGDVSFTVQITDSASITASKAFTLSIATGLTISTAPTLPAGTIGVPYSQTLIALGGRTPYAWSISSGSLPAGLSLNPTAGTLTGTPTAGGAFGFTVNVTDSASVKASKAFTVSISPPLTIVTAPSLPTGSTGVAYSTPLTASGGNPPYQWSIDSGALPAGITLDPATGNLAGTTTNSGSFTFTAQVTDSTSVSVTKSFSFTIAAGLAIGTAPGLPSATLATPYSINLAAVGGTAPYIWSITGGSLPGGVTLSSASGSIGGSPSSAGDFNFTVLVTDGAGGSASKGFTLTVVGGLAITTAPSLPDGTLNIAYSQALIAAGGSAPYTWSITAGSLPQGLALNPVTGVITGTPNTMGGFTFTVKVSDRANVSVTKQFTLKVGSDLTITTPVPLQDGVVGAAYSVTLAASGGKAPYGWSIQSGSLPAGLTLVSSGTIGGTPGTGGDFSFIVQVTDNVGVTATKSFAIHVALSALPNLNVSGLPATMDASQQSALILTLDAAYPAEITGQITLAFQPDATVNVDDPSVQFASGGRTVSFTIAANSLQPTAHIALQTGTVSGNITVTISYQSAGTTGSPITQTVHIARAVPNIRSVSVVTTGGGFEIHVIGWSTPRNLTNAIVHLTPAAGQNLQTTDLTVSLAGVAQPWYASAASAAFGSQFTLVLPFTISGPANAISAVSVELTNSVGQSARSSATY